MLGGRDCRGGRGADGLGSDQALSHPGDPNTVPLAGLWERNQKEPCKLQGPEKGVPSRFQG